MLQVSAVVRPSRLFVFFKCCTLKNLKLVSALPVHVFGSFIAQQNQSIKPKPHSFFCSNVLVTVSRRTFVSYVLIKLAVKVGLSFNNFKKISLLFFEKAFKLSVKFLVISFVLILLVMP